MQEEREERKLELMSEAIQAMKETPASTRMQDQGGLVETEAVAFGTYVGITLSKLSRRKFRQAKKCIGDILYNIEESEDASSCNTPVCDHQFDDKAEPQHLVPLRHFIAIVTIQQCSTQAVIIIDGTLQH